MLLFNLVSLESEEADNVPHRRRVLHFANFNISTEDDEATAIMGAMALILLMEIACDEDPPPLWRSIAKTLLLAVNRLRCPTASSALGRILSDACWIQA
jgi:hypothetical protein